MSYPPDPVHLRGKIKDEGCDVNPITDWGWEKAEDDGWKYTAEKVHPHGLCCATCKKNLIILDEIANLAHGYKSLNGTLGAIGSTLLSILDKER